MNEWVWLHKIKIEKNVETPTTTTKNFTLNGMRDEKNEKFLYLHMVHHHDSIEWKNPNVTVQFGPVLALEILPLANPCFLYVAGNFLGCANATITRNPKF